MSSLTLVLMRWSNALALAVTQLRRNWTRTLLTSLGILVGVGAVITIVGIGQGAAVSIDSDLSSMGSNLLLVESGRGGGPQAHTTAPAFQPHDLEILEQRVAHLVAVAPVVSASVTAVSGSEEWQTAVTGSNLGWFVASERQVASGRLFTEGEERAGRAVCILGETVREELFGAQSPLGARVRLGAVDCEIIGVLAAKGENTMGMDQDNLVVAPVSMVQRRLVGSTDIASLLLSVDAPEHIDGAVAELDLALRELRHVTSDDTVNYEIRDTRELASMLDGVTTVLTGMLAAVAAVSLVVGGIGVMNVMLVSVTERTHEIGVRMAVGALEEDVMAQFLAEAMMLSGLGGALGIGLGLLCTGLGAWLLGVPFVVEPVSIVLGLAVSAGMGVVFGWVPARRAARLEPIDALRAP